jgi:hypothetical protein
MTFDSIDLVDEKSFRTRMMHYGIFWMTLPKPKKGPPPFEMLMSALIASSKPSEKVKYEDTLADVRYSVLKEFFEKYMVLDDFEKLQGKHCVVNGGPYSRPLDSHLCSIFFALCCWRFFRLIPCL